MNINFEKMNGIIPVVIQNYLSYEVLMLGFMNQEAYEQTKKDGKVTFFSRSKNRLWQKGESSGHFLEVKKMFLDCDDDSLLILVNPIGPTCHNGTDSCFGETYHNNKKFLNELESIIKNRKENLSEKSYTSSLFKSGTKKIAQKLGEEAVELALASMTNDQDEQKNEAADLFFHYLVLLENLELTLEDVLIVLETRNNK
jgi:phosphoribosyl-ATP pyrophosphohydrolase/phosphoribosyl-AMP cyclohydrolase